MKRLPEKKCEEILAEMRKKAQGGDTPEWKACYKKYAAITAYLEFPLGELTNPKIRGFVWVWGLTNAITTLPITKKDRFAAQGIEGKAQVKLDLAQALFARSQLPKFRRQIWTEGKVT